MTEEVFRFRPKLVGEVARVAGVPRETLRVWLRREYFRFPRPSGTWKRFTDFETIVIAVFARLLHATQDHGLAEAGSLLAAERLMKEWHKDEAGVPYFANSTFMRDRFMIFWRNAEGTWTADICDAPTEAQGAFTARVNESYTTAPVFTVVNLGTILKQVLLAIMDVEIEGLRSTEGEDE